MSHGIGAGAIEGETRWLLVVVFDWLIVSGGKKGRRKRGMTEEEAKREMGE